MVNRTQYHLIIEKPSEIAHLEHLNQNGAAGTLTDSIKQARFTHVMKIVRLLKALKTPGKKMIRKCHDLHLQLDLLPDEYWDVWSDIKRNRIRAYLAQFRHKFQDAGYLQFCNR